MAKFKKGQSGNPKGRPKKGNTATDILREFMDQVDPNDSDKRTRMTILNEKMYQRAIKDDTVAAKYIYDRIDGRPKETHDIQTPDGIELIITDELNDTDKNQSESEPETEGSLPE